MIKSIFVFLLIITMISGFVLLFHYRNDKQKVFGICFLTIFICFLLSIPLYIGMKNSIENTIKESISARNGVIISINKNESDNTPFKDKVERYNTICEIKYQVGKEVFTAWYRSVDIPVTNIEEDLTSTRGRFYKEEWIYND
ncbi:hypothetical protein [Paenibacillus camelliae]|uniref:hypothetical protein n=1 Tax=Paenibacillus camelliae TaxID=512410 RepID=UPI0020415BF1|nr:hypothetical protein [Paenibacillus camelliae]